MENILKYITDNSIKLNEKEINLLFVDRELNKNTLVKSHLPLVLKLAKKFAFATGYSLEDCISQSMEGLTKAIYGYDTDSVVYFTTYATQAITNQMYILNTTANSRDIIREPTVNKVSSNTKARVFSEYYGKDEDGNEKLPFEDRMVYEECNENIQDTTKIIELIKRCLKKDKWSDIVIQRLGLITGEKVSLVNLGIQYGTSHQNIQSMYTKSIERLKEDKSFIHELTLTKIRS
tara:strand:- start:120 stop:821 length:702 start_codon:yes stop_codon:yes gene_type:complete